MTQVNILKYDKSEISIKENTCLYLLKSDAINKELNVRIKKSGLDVSIIVRLVISQKSRSRLRFSIFAEKDSYEGSAVLDVKVLLTEDLCSSIVLPELVIEQRNISVNHKVSIGGYNPESLTYLCSRGLTVNSAKQLLAENFLNTSCLENTEKV